MKRILFTAICITGIVFVSQAQNSGRKSSKNTPAVSNTTIKKNQVNPNNKTNFPKDSSKSITTNNLKSAPTGNLRVTPTDSLNNRDIYQWSNGQNSTPTGNEATSTNGDSYASLKKDTAKPKGKQN